MTGRVANRLSGDRRAWLELGVLVAILVLAALLRLPGLDQRGQWDSDQGHDMTVLAALVQRGQVPLLGPVTSVGTFHHGALYYYLLAPAAFVSGADPVAVMAEIALLGVGAVAATWWLARLVGGRLAAAGAALLLAVSPAGISESTFIWNPNPIPLFATLAVGGAVQARRTGAARWWLLAAVGTMATMQLHWLGGVLAIPVAGMWAWELRRRRRVGLETSSHVRAGLAGAAVLLAGYLPLLAHELTHDASETRAVIAYLTGGGSGSGASVGLVGRIGMVGVRSLTWPVAGLVTDRIAVSLVALVVVACLAAAAIVPASVLRKARGQRGETVLATSTGGAVDRLPRWPAAWLLATIATAIPALAVLAPSLAVVVPGLPNDHYHAFLDPIVLTLVATGAARLAGVGSIGVGRDPGAARESVRLRAIGRVTGGAGLAALGLIAVTAWPPAVSPDGGWRLADAAAAHITNLVEAGWPPDEPRLLVSLPAFKPDDTLRFPLSRHGLALEPPLVAQPGANAAPPGVVIVVCDPLFDDATKVPCGGLAEDSWLSGAYPPSSMQLVERFHAGSRRVISIYAPSRIALAP